MTDKTPHKSKISDLILTRTLKNGPNINKKEEDLRIMLKLRKNRNKISSLAEDISMNNFNYEKQEPENDFFENIEAIENILHNMRKELKKI